MRQTENTRSGVQQSKNAKAAHTDRRATRTTANAGNPMTIDDICTELGIVRSTFYEWRQKGSAPRCIKLPNGGIRIRRTEYDRWLTSREEAA
jgi:predicted DNA-binding transcriptional regulator AlpA